MDDEFKLCWKNFQDNIASGFQNLYDRGDLVDVTLACDGKLLHAHKIVLAICSPYFQEIFITNPCKHPIIILKDVTFNIMCELLEFMYQGVVNVKHTELQSFMKIGQLLQIKGLATNASSTAGSGSTDKTVSQTHNSGDTSNTCGDVTNHSATAKSGPNSSISGDDANAPEGLVSVKLSNPVSVKSHSPASSPSPMGFGTPVTLNQQNFKTSPETNTPLQQAYHVGANLKRHAELNSDVLSIYSRKQFRRSMVPMENNADHSDSADADTESDFFLSSIPHLTTNTSAAAAAAAAASFRGTFNPAAFGFDYNLYKNSGAGTVGIGAACGNSGNGSGGPEYPNDLHMPSDYSKNFTNHMDIPSIAPGEHWFHGKLEFMLSQRGKPLLVHDGHTFGIQYVRKDKKYWQCNLSRKFNCKARVTTTDTGEIIVTNNEHCHTEIRQHLRKDYQRNKVMMNALLNLSTNRLAENLRRQSSNSSTASNMNNFNNFSTLSHSVGLMNPAATVPGIASPGNSNPYNFHSGNTDQHQHTQEMPDFSTESGNSPQSRSAQVIHSQQMKYENANISSPLECGAPPVNRSLTVVEANHDCGEEVSRRSGNNGGDWNCKNEIIYP